MGEKTPQAAGRKARDKSFVLLLVGFALLLPPVAGVALVDGKVFGLPIPLVYGFSVWGILIAGGAFLARPLRDLDTPSQSPETSTSNKT